MANFKSGVQGEIERGNYRTFIRKAIYLYGDSEHDSLRRFLVQTYCTINMKEDQKARPQEDSLISFEPYAGATAPPGYERGVRVLGTLPIIPVGDTRVGYDTVTKKIVFMGDLSRLKMASKLKREDRYCRVYVIESCSAQRLSASLDLGIKEIGFNEEWEVVKREMKGKLEFLPNTITTKKLEQREREAPMRKERECDPIENHPLAQRMSTQIKSLKDPNNAPSTSRASMDVQRWIDTVNNDLDDAHSMHSARSSGEAKKSTMRIEKNILSILKVLNQCMLSLDETTLYKVSTKLSMEVEVEEYFTQRVREQGYGKKIFEVSEFKGRQTIASAGTEFFTFQKKDGAVISGVRTLLDEQATYCINSHFHFIAIRP